MAQFSKQNIIMCISNAVDGLLSQLFGHQSGGNGLSSCEHGIIFMAFHRKWAHLG